MNSPVTAAIAYTLLHSLWQGAVIAALLAALFLIIRSASIRYAAACAALLAIPGCFAVTLFQQLAGGASGAPSASSVGLPAWRSLPDWGHASSSGAFLIPWLTPLWFAGVCVFSLRHVAGSITLGRLRQRGVIVPPAYWHDSLQTFAAGLGLARPVQMLESCLVETPMVLGYFRPVILMPLGLLTGLPRSQVEAILYHELAHIRRLDYLINNLQRLVESLLFYHPAVWWISHLVRTERENCCDDMVVALRGDAHGYAAALASLEETRTLALAATGGNLLKRIRRLLYPQRPNGVWSAVLATLILATTATALLAAWHQTADEWLNHDVVYIINDQERAAYQNLATEAERQQFVEQFWLRRDPTPGTAVNEFKDEHYRRIGYANVHLHAVSGREGWQTDRGHIYIVYGPPDEIDSHPNDVHPTETWMYKQVESLGNNIYVTFVDPNKTGEFSLLIGKKN